MRDIRRPEQFDSFCVGFDVALYRDAPRKRKGDFDAFIDGAIAYGLDGWDRRDLTILRDFLTSVLEGPDSAAMMNQLWKMTRPRYAFFSGPDAPADKPAIIQIFTRVLRAIEPKLT
ncbi:hypothetical protein [Methylocystis echinoides]|uniref:Uncharacterized protein n=1 Tax=Methylocystis echinoides TaxID=29468 RepID=A0A9W6GSI9_9HYPH|nr:hypothetical protein [Methylocystis echinoides]GLI92071.1 hypothetical protein LMG27198_10630 [Methylocystis echinoides]